MVFMAFILLVIVFIIAIYNILMGILIFCIGFDQGLILSMKLEFFSSGMESEIEERDGKI